MKTIGIVGCGNLGSMIAQGIIDKLSDYYKIIAVLDNNANAANELSELCKCKSYTNVEEFLSNKLDYVIEAAAPIVLSEIGIKVLQSNSDLIPLSIGALANDEFYSKLIETANSTGKRVYLVSGAIGGLDLMRAAMFSGNVSAKITTRKAPKSLIGSLGIENKNLSDKNIEVVFEGNAREAISLFPKNVNVAVALGVSTSGIDKTCVKIISDPSVTNNIHTIELSGDFGEASITISAKPSPNNPRSSKLAAMAVLAKLESLAAPISYF